jgi:hypothetical protein
MISRARVHARARKGTADQGPADIPKRTFDVRFWG